MSWFSIVHRLGRLLRAEAGAVFPKAPVPALDPQIGDYGSQKTWSAAEAAREAQNRKQYRQYISACAVLNVNPASTPEQITRAYRQAMGLCHPDKLESKTAEAIRMATKRAQELNQAYAAVKSIRKF